MLAVLIEQVTPGTSAVSVQAPYSQNVVGKLRKRHVVDRLLVMTTLEPTEPQTGATSNYSLVVAIIWAVLAAIFASVLLSSATDEAYGGDAYTGIQNAVMLAVRGIAFLLVGSASLGVVIALKRERH